MYKFGIIINKKTTTEGIENEINSITPSHFAASHFPFHFYNMYILLWYIFLLLLPPIWFWSNLLFSGRLQSTCAPTTTSVGHWSTGMMWSYAQKLSAQLVSARVPHAPPCFNASDGYTCRTRRFLSPRSSRSSLPRLHLTGVWLPCATTDAREGRWPMTN